MSLYHDRIIRLYASNGTRYHFAGIMLGFVLSDADAGMSPWRFTKQAANMAIRALRRVMLAQFGEDIRMSIVHLVPPRGAPDASPPPRDGA